MAVTFGAAIGSAVSEVSGDTLTITTSVTATVDQWIVLRVAADNLSATTPTFTATDSAGNTYTTVVQGAQISTAAAGVAGAILTAPVTSELASGGTITLTLSGAVVAKSATAETFNGVGGLMSGGFSVGSGVSTVPTVNQTGVIAGSLVIGAVAYEHETVPSAYDTDTTLGSWSTGSHLPSATGGTATTHVSIVGQHKIATGSGTQGFGLTIVSADYVALTAHLRPPTDGTATPAARTIALTIARPQISGNGTGGGDLIGSDFSTVSGSTLAITTTAAALVGQTIVVRIAADNLDASTPTFTATDSAGNSYTTVVEGAVNAAAAAGVAGAIIYAPVTSELASGATITVTLSGAVACRAAMAHHFVGVGAPRAAGTSLATGAVATTTTTNTTPVVGDLIVGVLAQETWQAIGGYDSDITNGAWAAGSFVTTGTSGTATVHVSVAGQHKVVTATGSQIFNLTSGGAVEYVIATAVFEPYVVVADGTATPSALSLTTTIAAPTTAGSSAATPTAMALVVVVDAPTATAEAAAGPATVETTAVVPAPTATGGSAGGGDAVPETVVLAAAVVAPGATGGTDAAATPAAVALTVVTPAPTASASSSATATPTSVTLAAVTPAPTATGAVTFSTAPAAVTRTVVVPAPTVTTGAGGVVNTVATVRRAAVIATPTVTGTGTDPFVPAPPGSPAPYLVGPDGTVMVVPAPFTWASYVAPTPWVPVVSVN